MSSTTPKVFTLTISLINDSPDDGGDLRAQLEAGLLKVIREYRASAGMCQLFVTSCVEAE